jgi:hypothetical protein
MRMGIQMKHILQIGVVVAVLVNGQASAQQVAPECFGASASAPSVPPVPAQRKPVLTREGYFDVVMPVEYLDSITSMRKIAKPVAQPSTQGSWTLLATLAESPNRKTFIWQGGSGQAMLTTWDFLADGASICRPTTALNTKVGPDPATLSLVRSQSRTDIVMWKLGWIREKSRQYELYVEDRMRDGRPQLNRNQITAIALSLSPLAPPR